MKSKIESGSETVSVQTIERDLRNLWEQMAEVSQAEQREPVMRACVLNLIVYAPGEQSVGEMGQIMAEVTTQHPSRIIVMLPNPEATQPHLNAWVTAQCYLAAGGRKQVCCEQIMITAEGGATDWLPSLVRPLLVPDLPVVLWWRNSPGAPSRLFNELLKTADRVIIDAATLGDPLEGLANIAAVIKQKDRWTAFSDLSWARLTPWRDLIAGFFDGPDYRPYLWRPDRVEIECRKKPADDQVIPGSALLMMGWLATRLRWNIRTKPKWTDADTCQFELSVDNRPIIIQIKTPASTDRTPGGLSA
ncbi:MAG: glucose-6-phosphate dehydrogenase assembly protein OpcA, partial [Candidatus Methylomirabilales bacterium]